VVLDFNEKIYESLPKTKIKAFFEVMQKVDDLLCNLLEDKRSVLKNSAKIMEE
jgi:succinate dehydrogenase flavin-adding protein (antitoxin of CptAB toxin-antitoxin module)